MNRLSNIQFRCAVAIVAVVAITATGCSRPWTNWFRRGAECDTCPSAPMVESWDSAPGNFAPGATTIEQLPVPPS